MFSHVVNRRARYVRQSKTRAPKKAPPKVKLAMQQVLKSERCTASCVHYS